MALILPDNLPLPLVETDEFVVHRGSRAYALPAKVPAKYVGASAGNPSVTYGNFIIRFNTALLNLEIATLVGTEAIHYFSFVAFGNAQFDTAAAITVTTVFQTLGDAGVVPAAEMRRLFFGPVLVTDTREYCFDFHTLSATKIAMRLADY